MHPTKEDTDRTVEEESEESEGGLEWNEKTTAKGQLPDLKDMRV